MILRSSSGAAAHAAHPRGTTPASRGLSCPTAHRRREEPARDYARRQPWFQVLAPFDSDAKAHVDYALRASASTRRRKDPALLRHAAPCSLTPPLCAPVPALRRSHRSRQLPAHGTLTACLPTRGRRPRPTVRMCTCAHAAPSYSRGVYGLTQDPLAHGHPYALTRSPGAHGLYGAPHPHLYNNVKICFIMKHQ
uniref:Uncharacterized protein n=1 Tax=Heliothis virescens TaxID=7102 RepID=A0A2A4JNM3_HELVI